MFKLEEYETYFKALKENQTIKEIDQVNGERMFVVVEIEVVVKTQVELLQEQRKNECFNVLESKSKLWYDNLTEVQYNELNTWYNAWLNVTDTLVVPTKPTFLENID